MVKNKIGPYRRTMRNVETCLPRLLGVALGRLWERGLGHPQLVELVESAGAALRLMRRAEAGSAAAGGAGTGVKVRVDARVIVGG